MEMNDAVHALSALAHEGRLKAFRLLVKAGKAGMPSGEIARTLGVPANTLSNSLTVLANAGLVESRREGKLVIYTVRFGEMTRLLGFLIEDCCAASEEICAPLSDIALKSCC
jgi:DNA-binding transcriptional ArsR family regulator